MTAIVCIFVAMLAGHVRAGIVELNCSDNACLHTCLENMAKEFVRSVRQEKTVKLFDVLTVEPLKTKEARSNDGIVSKFFENHAFTFDWDDWSLKLTKAKNVKDAVEIEVFESRTAKDVSEVNSKKSSTKDLDEGDKEPKRLRHRRKKAKKVFQAVVPLLVGMKTAAIVLFATAVVTVITLKAFLASKMALLVTAGMAMKKLYESYGQGVGLQNNPYIYSQYPIDFSSASSHAYSMSGVNPQFASPEMFNPTGLATNSQTQELLQQNDATAQQSQQAPTLQLLNSTHATERWDGKSLLQKFIDPIVDGAKNIIDPIAKAFYGAMPTTFRGLNTDVSTTNTLENVSTTPEEKVVRLKEILLPQPRNIAQRKMTYRKTVLMRPKKYSELKVDLDRLKVNKGYHDFVKTKKYKHNYHNTYYYPTIKYYVNPDTFFEKPNNNKLIPYKKESTTTVPVRDNFILYNASTEWKPILVLNYNEPFIGTNSNKTSKPNDTLDLHKIKNRIRNKRSIDPETEAKTNKIHNPGLYSKSIRNFADPRGFYNIYEYFSNFFTSNLLETLSDAKYKNTKTKITNKNEIKAKSPPKFYTLAYDLLMYGLEAIDGLLEVQSSIGNTVKGKTKPEKLKNKKTIKSKLPYSSSSSSSKTGKKKIKANRLSPTPRPYIV